MSSPESVIVDNQATVDVLLCAYNAGDTIEAAVLSVAQQSLRPKAIIVVDDGSTDRTCELVKALSVPGLVLVKNEKNLGLTRSLNRGLAKCTARYVARIDADDVCDPNRLHSQVLEMETRPELALLGTSVVFDDGRSRTPGYQVTGRAGVLLELLFGFTVLHPTAVIRRDALRQVGGGYDEAWEVGQDLELWDRLSMVGGVDNLSACLVTMNVRPFGRIGVERRMEQIDAQLLVRRRQLKRLGVPFTGNDLCAFNRATAGEALTLKDLRALASLISRLTRSNNESQVYDKDLLVTRAFHLILDSYRAHVRHHGSGLLAALMLPWSVFSSGLGVVALARPRVFLGTFVRVALSGHIRTIGK